MRYNCFLRKFKNSLDVSVLTWLDVMHDGRFVVLRRTAPPASPSLDLIVNWFDVVRWRARP